MNGPHDVGGAMGHGPVAPDPDEPLFHAPWEARALGLTLCCNALGHWGIDEGRHARESLPPAIYYGSSYYEIWARALTDLLLRHGELTERELRELRPIEPGLRTARRLEAERVAAVLAAGGPAERQVETVPRFAPGARVRTRNMHPEGHTRLPGYARDKVGTVEAVRGAHVFPDSSAHGGGERPQWLYTVAFDGRTLWGEDGDPGLTVSVDAFEPYLDAA